MFEDFLARHYLFRDLDEKTRSRIMGLVVTRKLGANETLFIKGDTGDGVYGVLSGRVKISTSSPARKELALNVM